MGNIIDYARTETRSFEALPFREADALVLAQLSYDEVPECVLRLDDLVAKYGTLQARAKQFDIRRPIASLRMLRKPPFGRVPMTSGTTTSPWPTMMWRTWDWSIRR